MTISFQSTCSSIKFQWFGFIEQISGDILQGMHAPVCWLSQKETAGQENILSNPPHKFHAKWTIGNMTQQSNIHHNTDQGHVVTSLTQTRIR